MLTTGQIEHFLDALNACADVAPQVVKTVRRALRGRAPTMLAHVARYASGEIVIAAEWIKCAHYAKRYVVIAWRANGARVDFWPHETLCAALAQACAERTIRIDGDGQSL